MSSFMQIWKGRNASLDYVKFFDEKKGPELVLHTSSRDAEQGARLSNEEARALAAVLLEFARDK